MLNYLFFSKVPLNSLYSGAFLRICLDGRTVFSVVWLKIKNLTPNVALKIWQKCWYFTVGVVLPVISQLKIATSVIRQTSRPCCWKTQSHLWNCEMLFTHLLIRSGAPSCTKWCPENRSAVKSASSQNPSGYRSTVGLWRKMFGFHSQLTLKKQPNDKCSRNLTTTFSRCKGCLWIELFSA